MRTGRQSLRVADAGRNVCSDRVTGLPVRVRPPLWPQVVARIEQENDTGVLVNACSPGKGEPPRDKIAPAADPVRYPRKASSPRIRSPSRRSTPWERAGLVFVFSSTSRWCTSAIEGRPPVRACP